MRLRILTHYYPPEVGAPQTRLAALAEGLARRGDEVVVHTCFPHYPDGEVKPPYRNRPLKVEGDGPVRVVRSWVHPAPNSGFARRIFNHTSFATSALASAAAGGPADVVLAETPPLVLAGAAAPYARAKRAKLVLNVADLWPDSAVEMGTVSSPRAIAVARLVERSAYRSAAAIACPTEGILKALEARPESAGKARLMRPAVDLERFDPDPGTREEASAGRPLRVLYAGTVGLAHGLGTLLDALEEVGRRADVPPIETTIAGDGADAPALRAHAEQLGLLTESGFLGDGMGPKGAPTRRGAAAVRMPGAVTAGEIPGLYAESDVAVVMLRDLPIFAGALPTKMLEAMAAGRPVVLSAPRGEATRLIDDEGAGVVVPPEDPRALAGALLALARDPHGRAAMGAAGRRAVERDFGRDAWLSSWRKLLASAYGTRL